MDAQIVEIRQIAIHNLVGFTPKSSEFFKVFLAHAKTLVKDLKKLTSDDVAIAHDALRALINLSSEDVITAELDDADFTKHLIQDIIVSKTNILADLGCMLLSNMSKRESIADKIIDMTLKPVDGITTWTTALGQLADVFNKGADKGYNKECNYDFLSGVFATIAMLPKGRTLLFQKDQDGVSALSKVVCFTEHPSVIRRGGSITTIKNACFSVENHPAMLDENDINVLPYLLLPLCGPEEFDLDDMEDMPQEIQLLPPEKKRESDAHLRETLLEAIVLLTSTKDGRAYLRAKKTYPVIQKMHLAEESDRVQEIAEQIVQMLMREEAAAEITEIVEDDEEAITEV
ncbi:hypothetical protein BGZ73_002339 [Actinomortierella ambigua]|nr:hypothetical protein BGZ73_002339 [Actinomortierella ambigua]